MPVSAAASGTQLATPVQLQQQIDDLRHRLAELDDLRVQLNLLETQLQKLRPAGDGAVVQSEARNSGCYGCTTAKVPGSDRLAANAAAVGDQGQPASPAKDKPGAIFPDQRDTALTQNAFAAGGERGTVRLGALDLTVGGFVEIAGIYRSRNEAADTAASGATEIPLPQSARYHQGEMELSARSSRLAFLTQTQIGSDAILAAYFETDFLGSSDTSNPVQSNSYQPRLRHAFVAYKNYMSNIEALAGQTWSLITPNTKGVFPPNELVTATIDLSLTAGYLYNRQAQIRVAKEIGPGLWFAVSLENPDTVYYSGPNGAAASGITVTTSNPGSGGFDSQVNYSDNVAPDVIVKAAADTRAGHFELFGLARAFRTRVSMSGAAANHTVAAGGIGGDFYVPLGTHVTAQGSILAGSGIGRYAAAGFPDATVGPRGEPVPLPEIAALAGVVVRPSTQFSLYSYLGTEGVTRRSFDQAGKAYGYGNPLYGNSGCWVEASTGPCTANTSRVVELTTGGWWRLLKGGGGGGALQAGLQYSFTRRSLFDALGGGGAVKENTVYVALRYSPLQ